MDILVLTLHVISIILE